MDKKSELMLKLEELQSELEEALPQTDSKHRDEILDIAMLLHQRVEKYINNYGLN